MSYIDDADDEAIREHLDFGPDETVTVRLELPSALWAHIDAVADDDETVAEWIERTARFALSIHAGGPENWDRVTTDVAIDPETWETIRYRALTMIQQGTDPYDAFHETMLDYIQVTPSLVVDGEAKGVADLAPRVEALLDDVDADAGEGHYATGDVDDDLGGPTRPGEPAVASEEATDE